VPRESEAGQVGWTADGFRDVTAAVGPMTINREPTPTSAAEAKESSRSRRTGMQDPQERVPEAEALFERGARHRLAPPPLGTRAGSSWHYHPTVLGTTIAHYRVLERLGEGGMGEVFLAEDLKLQRRAALKLISPTLTRDETRRQRFVQEARLAASIDHPHIAAIYDIGEVDGRTYIAMEYVEGGSLREVLKAGPLELRQAVEYAVQAGDALAKVHGRGVVHRDLKPENLLIARDGYLKIIDFGLAKLMDPVARSGLADAATVTDAQVRTVEGVVMGTMGYMSPEQVRGEMVDARSDIFSFGAVLYEMVTGVAPFRKRSAADTISAILGEMPVAARVEDRTVGTELQRVLRKCLAKEPDSRYQGMRDLVVDLRQLRESITSSETMSRPVEPTRESVTGWWLHPPVWIGAAVLAAIAAATLWSMRRDREGPITSLSEAAARPAVAVVPFEVIGGSPDVAWLAKGLPSMLITGLAQTPDIEVVGNERLGDAARQVGASTLDGVERSQLAEVSRRAGARFIVNGTIVQAGADLRIDARVEDLSTGAVRLAETVRGSDALALADDLSARVRHGLNVQTTPGTVRKVADVASASVDAFRAFTAGVEARSNERNADARGFFQEAVRVDPEFALAYVHLAEVDRHEGRLRENSRWLRMASQRLDRMPERDAVLVRAELARDAGRLDEADQLLEGLVASYPDTEQAWYNLTVSWWDVDPARSMTVVSRSVAALPYSPRMQNLYGYQLMNIGRLDDALRTFETYIKLRPSEPNALDSLAEGHLISGHITEALANYEAAIKGGFDSHQGKAWTLAVLGRYQEALSEASLQVGQGWNVNNTSTLRAFLLSRVGRYRVALQAVDLSQTQADQDGFTEAVVASHVARALFAFERRDCTGVAGHLGAAQQLTKGVPALLAVRWQVFGDLLAGSCAAMEGRLDAAKRRLGHAQTVYRSTSLLEVWWVHSLEGEVALAERDFDKAARAFAAGEPARKMFFTNQGIFTWLTFYGNNLVLRDGRARVAAAQGRRAEAIALYRGLLTPGPDQKWTAMLDPRHVIALARLLDKAGERDAARAEYQRFLEHWKDADADLPELAEARARLAR
jgi:serine/threonine protein kinase/tetratricopeptide (TPR) repeat protein